MQTYKCDATRLMNPLFTKLFSLTGKAYAFTKQERIADENCAIVRNFFRNYI